MPRPLAGAEFIPLSRAALMLQVSAKTLQKRMAARRISPVEDPHDRRVKLLTPSDLQKLQESDRKSTRIEDRFKSVKSTLRSVVQRVRDIDRVVTGHTRRLTTLERELAQATAEIKEMQEVMRRAGYNVGQRPSVQTPARNQKPVASQTRGNQSSSQPNADRDGALATASRR